jgi:hypothetical protein
MAARKPAKPHNHKQGRQRPQIFHIIMRNRFCLAGEILQASCNGGSVVPGAPTTLQGIGCSRESIIMGPAETGVELLLPFSGQGGGCGLLHAMQLA